MGVDSGEWEMHLLVGIGRWVGGFIFLFEGLGRPQGFTLFPYQTSRGLHANGCRVVKGVGRGGPGKGPVHHATQKWEEQTNEIQKP